jgi:hypothetical protein
MLNSKFGVLLFFRIQNSRIGTLTSFITQVGMIDGIDGVGKTFSL